MAESFNNPQNSSSMYDNEDQIVSDANNNKTSQPSKDKDMADPTSTLANAAPGVGAGVGGALGSYIGGLRAKGDYAKADALQQAAMDKLQGINAPTLSDVDLQTGYDLQKEQAINAGPSKYENISTNPEYQKQQDAALAALAEEGKTGLTPQDRAQLEDIRSKQVRDTHAAQQDILANMQQRGMGGSGATLASQLSAQQAAAGRASQQGLDLASTASQRALQAKMGAGQLAGQVRQQQFGEQSQQAQAEDIMKRFDIANQVAQQQRNVSAQNAESLYGANAMNQEQLQNKVYNPQNQYNMSSQAALLQAKGLQGEGQIYNQHGQAQQQNAQAIGSGIGQVAGIAGGAIAMSDKNLKQNIRSGDGEVEHMLDNIQSKEFEYKNSPSERQTGIIAQDLEKSPLGKKQVIDTPEGKAVKFDNPSTLLASLANLNKRLRHLENK